MSKMCNTCGETKDLTSFKKTKENKDGRGGKCKSCIELKAKEYREKNKDKIRLRENKNYTKNKEKHKARAKKYALKNKEKIKAYYDKWSDENSNHLKKYRDSYYSKNKERICQYKKDNRDKINKYTKKLREENKTYAIASNMRCRIHTVLKRKDTIKECATIEYLGCDIKFLKQYLSNRFTTGMSWDNYGPKGWHIDHIKPCAKFDLTDPEQQKICFHYTNLQPLWATTEIAMSYGEGSDYIGNLEKNDRYQDD